MEFSKDLEPMTFKNLKAQKSFNDLIADLWLKIDEAIYRVVNARLKNPITPADWKTLKESSYSNPVEPVIDWENIKEEVNKISTPVAISFDDKLYVIGFRHFSWECTVSSLISFVELAKEIKGSPEVNYSAGQMVPAGWCAHSKQAVAYNAKSADEVLESLNGVKENVETAFKNYERLEKHLNSGALQQEDKQYKELKREFKLAEGMYQFWQKELKHWEDIYSTAENLDYADMALDKEAEANQEIKDLLLALNGKEGYGYEGDDDYIAPIKAEFNEPDWMNLPNGARGVFDVFRFYDLAPVNDIVNFPRLWYAIELQNEVQNPATKMKKLQAELDEAKEKLAGEKFTRKDGLPRSLSGKALDEVRKLNRIIEHNEGEIKYIKDNEKALWYLCKLERTRFSVWGKGGWQEGLLNYLTKEKAMDGIYYRLRDQEEAEAMAALLEEREFTKRFTDDYREDHEGTLLMEGYEIREHKEFLEYEGNPVTSA